MFKRKKSKPKEGKSEKGDKGKEKSAKQRRRKRRLIMKYDTTDEERKREGKKQATKGEKK